MTKDELIYEEASGLRLDQYLTQSYPTFSRAYFEKIITTSCVQVNQKPAKKGLKLTQHDQIEIQFPPIEPLDLLPIAMPLSVLYEDDHLAVIDKPAHLVCHPAPGTYDPTLIHGLLHHFTSLAPTHPIRPGLVHRLDKDTSGVIVIAKTLAAHEHLANQFKNRQVKKRYLAVVHHKLEACTVDAPIGRHAKDRKKMGIAPLSGKAALTHFKPIEQQGRLTLIEATPFTGRTHQIRVHLQSLNRPIVGDPIYGNTTSDAPFSPPRLLLHAYHLEFTHPFTNLSLSFIAPLPNDFRDFLNINHFSFCGDVHVTQ